MTESSTTEDKEIAEADVHVNPAEPDADWDVDW